MSTAAASERVLPDSVQRAIEIIESSRLTHVHWAEWRRTHPHGDEMAGDLAHHEQAIRDYDHVLAVLRAASEALLLLQKIARTDLHETVRDSTNIVHERFDVAIYADDYRAARRYLVRLIEEPRRASALAATTSPQPFPRPPLVQGRRSAPRMTAYEATASEEGE